MSRHPEEDRVVITGIGCVTPLGHTVTQTWDAILGGQSAMAPITRFDPSGFGTTFAAEIKGFTSPLSGHHVKWSDDKAAFASAAVDEALADAGLERGQIAPHRMGISVGAEISRPDLHTLAGRVRTLKTSSPSEVYRSVEPRDFVVMAPWFPASHLAERVGAEGPTLTTSTACTSSAQAIGDAMRLLRRGEVDVMITGGTDRLVEEFMVVGFGLLGALSTRNEAPTEACRPFDRTRDGFVLGEGAGFVILERLSHARARGARIHAELLGYGCSANAWRITDSPPDGRGARQSMMQALTDARLNPDEVDYINAHGTSTQQNDASETAGIRGALGAAADTTPVSSTKSMMGHLVAACGAVELIVCVKAIAHGILPPTLNYEHPDPACDLDYVPKTPRTCDVKVALTNAFGFGGSNGTLAVARYEG
ncbi:MAG: beta-ketoacyl-[acyl-carrier-protein] synthase family protein [Bradymonadia bacterium]